MERETEMCDYLLPGMDPNNEPNKRQENVQKKNDK